MLLKYKISLKMFLAPWKFDLKEEKLELEYYN